MEAKSCVKKPKKNKPKSDKPNVLPDVWKNPKNENEIPELNGQKPFPPQLIKYLADLSKSKKNITENLVYEFKKAGLLKSLVKNIFEYNESYEILANLFGEKKLGEQRCNSFAKAIHESVGPPVSFDDEESDRLYPRKKNSMDDMEDGDEEEMGSEDDEESEDDFEDEDDMDSEEDSDDFEDDEDEDRFEFGDDQEFGDDDEDERPNGFEQSPPSRDQMGDEEYDDLAIQHSNKSRAHRNFMRSMNRYNNNF